MQLCHIAIVPVRDGVSVQEITTVSAALQTQVMRDFAPIWGIQATVDYFPSLDAVPLGYWPLMIVEDASGPGTHIDRNGQPVGYVEYGPTWSLTASHETLEMLADPSGMRTIAGDAPVGTAERVEFLLEVCDPCQSVDHAYSVNGVLVSDFYTPAYFEPLFTAGSKYSFCGALQEPRDVLPGGYLTWRSPSTGDWIQQRNDAGTRSVKNLGPFAAGATGLRAFVDDLTGGKQHLSHVSSEHGRVVAIRERARVSAEASRDRARVWADLVGLCSPSRSTKS
jgi:hypothetical protein